MASIKKERVLKINGGCSNNFELDVYHYCMWGAYTLIKEIALNDKEYLKASLSFWDWKDPESPYRYTGKYQIRLNVSKWTREDNGFSVSHGLGKTIIFDEAVLDKKAVKKLQEATKNVSDELILGIYSAYEDKILSDRII